MKTSRLAAAALAAALSVVTVGGVAASASAAETTVVKGHVRSFSGKAIGGVLFKVRVKISSSSSEYFTVSGRTSRTGRYEARVPRRDLYQLLVSDPGDDDKDTADGRWAPASTRVASTRGTVVIDQRLHPGAGLSGRVRDASGDPVRAGLRVTVGSNTQRGFIATGSTYTKAGGAYHFRNLAAGPTVVLFDGPGANDSNRFWTGTSGGSVFLGDAKSQDLRYGKKVTGIGLTFPARSSINGRVTVNGRTLSDDPDNRTAVAFNLLDQSGKRLDGGAAVDDFHFRDLQPGTYYLSFAGTDPSADHIEPEFYDDADSLETATPIVLKAGQTVSGLVVNLSAK